MTVGTPTGTTTLPTWTAQSASLIVRQESRASRGQVWPPCAPWTAAHRCEFSATKTIRAKVDADWSKTKRLILLWKKNKSRNGGVVGMAVWRPTPNGRVRCIRPSLHHSRISLKLLPLRQCPVRINTMLRHYSIKKRKLKLEIKPYPRQRRYGWDSSRGKDLWYVKEIMCEQVHIGSWKTYAFSKSVSSTLPERIGLAVEEFEISPAPVIGTVYGICSRSEEKSFLMDQWRGQRKISNRWGIEDTDFRSLRKEFLRISKISPLLVNGSLRCRWYVLYVSATSLPGGMSPTR